MPVQTIDWHKLIPGLFVAVVCHGLFALLALTQFSNAERLEAPGAVPVALVLSGKAEPAPKKKTKSTPPPQPQKAVEAVKKQPVSEKKKPEKKPKPPTEKEQVEKPASTSPLAAKETSESPSPEIGRQSSFFADLESELAAEIDSRSGDQNAGASPMAGRAGQSQLALAIRRQLYPCWNPPLVTDQAENQLVQLHLNLARNGSITKVEVVQNQASYAAIDRARRAVSDRRCVPLRLPEQRYDLWKNVIVTFDPQQLLP